MQKIKLFSIQEALNLKTKLTNKRQLEDSTDEIDNKSNENDLIKTSTSVKRDLDEIADDNEENQRKKFEQEEFDDSRY